MSKVNKLPRLGCSKTRYTKHFTTRRTYALFQFNDITPAGGGIFGFTAMSPGAGRASL